jgi:transposase
VAEDSDATLVELSQRLQERLGVKVVVSTVFKALAKMGITRKKKTSTRPSASGTTSFS